MRNGRPKPLLELTNAEVTQLQSFARSRSLPASLRQRARIVLASASGESNTDIAARLGLSGQVTCELPGEADRGAL